MGACPAPLPRDALAFIIPAAVWLINLNPVFSIAGILLANFTLNITQSCLSSAVLLAVAVVLALFALSISAANVSIDALGVAYPWAGACILSCCFVVVAVRIAAAYWRLANSAAA